MPKPKIRKKHSPKTHRKVDTFSGLPMTAAMLQGLKRDMTTRLLRLQMGGGDGKDIATLVVYFGQAWLLAGAMEKAEVLRRKFEEGVKALGDAITHDLTTAIEKHFNTLFVLIELALKIFALSTRGEYQRASEKLEGSYAVAFVDEFFDVAAQAKLLEIN